MRRMTAGLGIWVLLSGCDLRRPPRKNSESSPAGAETTAPEVTFHGPRGDVRLTLIPRGKGDWDAVMPEGATLRIRATNSALEVLDAQGSRVAYVVPSPGGYQLFNLQERLALRVVLPEGVEARHTAFDVLSAEGIAVVRIAKDPVRGSAIGRDSAGQPFLHTRLERTGIGLFSRDGTRMGDVEHLDDPIAAVILGLETLPIAHRAALVVTRLGLNH